MKLSVSEDHDIILKQVYNSIVLITDSGEEMAICMRDGGFEFKYNGDWWRACQGEVVNQSKLSREAPTQPQEEEEVTPHPYYHLLEKANYDKLLNSGMFWEFHPELSGDFPRDHRYMLRELYPPTKLLIDQFTGREIGGILNYYNIKNN